MITVKKTTVAKYGACNNCDRMHKIIFHISILKNEITIRLCSDCKKELEEKLRISK